MICLLKLNSTRVNIIEVHKIKCELNKNLFNSLGDNYFSPKPIQIKEISQSQKFNRPQNLSTSSYLDQKFVASKSFLDPKLSTAKKICSLNKLDNFEIWAE